MIYWNQFNSVHLSMWVLMEILLLLLNYMNRQIYLIYNFWIQLNPSWSSAVAKWKLHINKSLIIVRHFCKSHVWTDDSFWEFHARLICCIFDCAYASLIAQFMCLFPEVRDSEFTPAPPAEPQGWTFLSLLKWLCISQVKTIQASWHQDYQLDGFEHIISFPGWLSGTQKQHFSTAQRNNTASCFVCAA